MYKALLFHPKGDYVIDFTGKKDIQDVWNEIAEMGSRWIFYPIPFVATDKAIVDTPEGLELLKGKRIATVSKLLQKQWDLHKETICDRINTGEPFEFIYDFEFAT